MASIRKQKRTWFACITLADGTRTQRSTGIKDLGSPKERAEKERLAQSIAQEFEDTARGNKTESLIRKSMGDLFNRVSKKRMEFAQTDLFFRSWLDRVKIRKSNETWMRYVQVTDDFLAHLGKRATVPLSEITVEDIQSFLDTILTSGRRGKTARNTAKILSIPFNFAHRQGLLLTNPVAGADIPDDIGESKSPFTTEQVKAILRVSTDGWATVARLGAFTGARLRDCANMTWKNVDFAEKVLRYRPHKTKRFTKDVVCPIHTALEAHLLSLPSADNEDAPLAPTLAKRYTGGRQGLSKAFDDLLHAAGIPNEPTIVGKGKGRAFKPYGFHSFRHTFKTILVNAGVEVQTVDVLTGHAKKSVSEIYIHRSPELLRQAVTKLPAFA